MPLSDAAKALLAGRTTTAAPGTPPPALGKPEATEEQQGFRDRAAREDERFRLATDSEYWVTFGFRAPDLPAQFCKLLGVTPHGDGRFVKGPELTAAVGDRRHLSAADKVKQMLAVRAQRAGDMTTSLTTEVPPNPVDEAPETGDLAVDSLAELRALHAAMQAPANPDPADVLDSPHWVAAYWPSREAKDEFLLNSGLDVLGDKYLDGHQAAQILGLRLR